MLIEAEEPEVYATLTMAEEAQYELERMQPENIYKVVKVE